MAPESSRTFARLPGVWLAVVASLALACVPEPAAPKDGSRLILSPGTIAFGRLARGEGARASLTVSNPGDGVVVVDRIETSCDCIRVTPGGLRLDGRESKALSVAFDPSDEGDFQGELEVHLTGFAPAGAVLFRTAVALEVRPPTTSPRRAGRSGSESVGPASESSNRDPIAKGRSHADGP